MGHTHAPRVLPLDLSVSLLLLPGGVQCPAFVVSHSYHCSVLLVTGLAGAMSRCSTSAATRPARKKAPWTRRDCVDLDAPPANHRTLLRGKQILITLDWNLRQYSRSRSPACRLVALHEGEPALARLARCTRFTGARSHADMLVHS